MRKFGYPLLTKFVSEEKLKSCKFLHNTTRLETLIFLLFFIPGTPKDVLTYVAGITPSRWGRFLLPSLFARIPSVISSTFIVFFFHRGEYPDFRPGLCRGGNNRYCRHFHPKK